MTTLNDPLGHAFIKFFESQGVRFVDADTGETVTWEDGKIVRKKEAHEGEDNVSLKSAREWRTADNRRLKGEA